MQQTVNRTVLVLLMPIASPALSQTTSYGVAVSGTFRPAAPPQEPVRRIVGESCVVDLKQSYSVDGSFTGVMHIDFRIFVAGDCAQPPGTHDERWIAHGTFAVRSEGSEYSGTLIYLADVISGGAVSGSMTLAGELSAELEVEGTFEDGYMRYKGMRIRRADR